MKTFTYLLSTFALCLAIQVSAIASPTIGDSINVPRIIQPPVIDGSGSDLCWDSAAWNPMPYVWLPYGQIVDSSDFYGRFKAVWNEQQNLMYFLFEITDDKFVNGYVFSSSNGNYYLFDVVEIFIDENRSGGDHTTNNNAFAYHITSGNSTTDFDVIDMWSNIRVNYKDHLPEFKRVKTGNVYTWEFSLMVLTDTYTPASTPVEFKSTLQAGKRMGFSAAYCDNDNSAVNPQRDHFVASKYLSAANSNNSYMNASYFGFMKLVNEPTANPATSVIPVLSETLQLNVYPNPVTEFANLSFSKSYVGRVDISVFNSTGQLINKITSYKSQTRFEQKIDFNLMSSGVYFIKMELENDQMFVKVIK